MTDDQKPQLRIVRGAPTAEELAALTAIVAAAGAARDDAPNPQPVRGRWNDPVHQVRRFHQSGPGAWLAAGR